MEYFGKESYKKKFEDGKLQLPVTFRPEDRDELFWVKVCNYVYGSYSSHSQTFVTNGGIVSSGRTISQLRAYARGNQDVQKYKKQLDFRSDRGERSELDTISWENTRIFNKFRSVALQRLGQARYQPAVKAVDDLATEQRMNAYYEDKLMSDPRMQQIMVQAGVELPQSSPVQKMGLSPQEVDAFEMLGGYTLASEIMLQDAIQASMEISGWERIADKCDQDLFDLGLCSAMIYRVPNDPKVYVRYVDPAGLIVPRSTYDDFSDSQYRAVIERRTIADLRIETNMDEEKLLEAAKQYSSYSGNPQFTNEYYVDRLDGRRENFSALRSQRYDEFSIEVMTLYFIATDVEKYVTGNTKYGNSIFSKVKSDAELSQRDIRNGKEFVTNPVQYVYRCKWIVGTNIVFDYGKDDTIVRWGESGNKRAIIPLVVHAINEPSMVERCIPTIDDLEISVRKKRLSLAMMPPGPNFGVDMALLEPVVDIAGEQFTVKELLGVFFNRGILFYNSKGEYEHIGQEGANRPPITPLPNNKMSELQAFVTEAQFLVGEIRDLIGINAVADGSINPNDLLNGVAQQMSAATSSALHSNYKAMRDFFVDVEKVIGLKYKIGVIDGDIKISYVPGSRTAPKAVNLDKRILDHDFYFVATALPSQEDKQNIIMYLTKLSQEGRISESAYFMVYNMIQEGDVQKAQFFLAIEANKADQMKQQQQMQMVQAQAQANAQSAQAAEQARAQTAMAETNGAIELEKVKHQNRLIEMERKYQLEIQKGTTEKTQDIIGQTAFMPENQM